MLFLTYWELNEDMPIQERHQIAARLTEEGHFPPDDVELLRWDATPDGWGIVVAEAESAAAMQRALNVWRASGEGFFETTRTAPALTVQEAVATNRELLEALC